VFGQQLADIGGGRAKPAGSSSIILTNAGIFQAGASFKAFQTKSDFVYVPIYTVYGMNE
jgi:hypothetical protein